MNERQNKILELLLKEGKVEVVQLSHMLGVSQVTIRKDLNNLEEKGIIKREHGYAIIKNDDNMNMRLAYHYERKRKIALKAIEDVKDGETVMVESGSCCALVVEALSQYRKDITVITNSSFICDYVQGDITFILLGGLYQKESQVNVGPLTIENAKTFFVEHYFIGTDGFTKEAGFTGKNYMRCESVKAISNQAKKVIIVTESEKFSRQEAVSLIPLSKVYAVVTDQNIPEEDETYLLEHNIKVNKS